MEQKLISTGIDVGTSTTQVVFSRLTVQEESGYGWAPKVSITDKEVIYRSRIHETPLKGEGEIDGAAVAELIAQEYRQAGWKPEQIHTGAVIITGESSRKSNADEVVHALSAFAGDFVIAEAGPELESVLAGKGAGGDRLSKSTGKIVANLDVGGGTANICVFKDGEVVDTACYNIGGRLLRVRNGKVYGITGAMRTFLEETGIGLEEGQELSLDTAERICGMMAELLAQAVGCGTKSCLLRKMTTSQELSGKEIPELLTFSGGVADCLHSTSAFRFGDLGDLLGQAISRHPGLMEKTVLSEHETIRATVIGAGNYSLKVTGSTIDYEGRGLPLKNVPVLWVPCEKQEDIGKIREIIREKRKWLPNDTGCFAVAMKGIRSPSFQQIEELADLLCGVESVAAVILEEDIGKALGQALKRRMGRNAAPVCVDEIWCRDGDYIDLGMPLGAGYALPVAVKTLLFGI